jgi:hypothetical protein
MLGRTELAMCSATVHCNIFVPFWLTNWGTLFSIGHVRPELREPF